MTVIVDTPEGPRTGSSVIEVVTRWDNAPPHASGVHSQVHGEAVAVDLPGDKTLFALLRNDKAGVDAAQYYAREALGFTGGQSNRDTYYAAIEEMRTMGGAHQLPPSSYPLLVYFRDLDDPRTVERIDAENLAATFGGGVELRTITVEITDDAVTNEIEDRLGWLDDYYNRQLDGERYNNSTKLANGLNTLDILRGG